MTSTSEHHHLARNLFPCATVFFCAASSVDAVLAACDHDIDLIIIDLEDEIKPGDKAAARATLKTIIDTAQASGKTLAGKVLVRINGCKTPWFAEDLDFVDGLDGIDGIVLPKAEAASDIHQVVNHLGAEKGQNTLIFAVIESPPAILNLMDIMSVPELDGITMGPFDLSRAIGAQRFDDAPPVSVARTLTLMAARANGIAAVDGPVNKALSPEERTAAIQTACRMGFDGKIFNALEMAATVRQIFKPSQANLSLANEIVAAFSSSASPGGETACGPGGATFDINNLSWARRTLQQKT